MTDHDSLRRGLRALAGDPLPATDLRSGAERRARRIRHRRATAAASGTLALAVIVGASMPSGTAQLVSATDPPLPVGTSVPPLPTGLPSLSPSPSPSSSPSTSPKPTGSATPMPAPTFAPNSDNRPLYVAVADPGPAKTATWVTLAISVHRRPEAALRLVVDWGDGKVEDNGVAAGGTCPDAPDEPPADYIVTIAHAYRAAGAYEVSVRADEMASCAEVTDTARDRVRIDVEQGPVVSNGPGLPMGRIAQTESSTEQGDLLSGKTYLVRLKGTVRDSDGWVTSVTIDWGDGSEPQVIDYGTTGCTETPTTWPESYRTVTAQHSYAARGSYEGTLTVTSTGCSGSDTQTTSSERLVRRIEA